MWSDPGAGHADQHEAARTRRHNAAASQHGTGFDLSGDRAHPAFRHRAAWRGPKNPTSGHPEGKDRTGETRPGDSDDPAKDWKESLLHRRGEMGSARRRRIWLTRTLVWLRGKDLNLRPLGYEGTGQIMRAKPMPPKQ